jgi:hypothetical protein
MLLDAKSCEKKTDSQIPTCIQQMITEYQNRSAKGPSGKFLEYDYKGNKVYLFEPPCCDQISKLYDSHCNLICSAGGFTGKIDSLCVDFYKTRTNEKLIWEDVNQKQ